MFTDRIKVTNQLTLTWGNYTGFLTRPNSNHKGPYK